MINNYMNNFDNTINIILEEDWKSMAAAGLVGLGTLGGAHAAEPNIKPDIRITKQAPKTDNKSYTINILARTLWAEGKGESDLDTGLRAIATSIYNRKNIKVRGGKIADDDLAYAKIVLSPKQYSCWNGLMVANPKKYPEERERSGRAFELGKQIAEEMVNGTFKPVAEVKNATHYFAPSRMESDPYWAKGQEVATIGNHNFVTTPIVFRDPVLGNR
jgi:hypothetical protein